jgi:hypothetical protein
VKKAFIFVAMVAAIALTACQKEDNLVDMSQLVGKWYRTGVIGAGKSYTFDKDGGYMYSSVNVVNPTKPNGIHRLEEEGKYEVSTNNGTIITLIGEVVKEQYLLLELNSQTMKWKNVYGGEGEETTFARVTD